MQSRFLLDGAEHALWLSRQEGGYRLHLADDPHGMAVSLGASSPPEGEVAGAKHLTGGDTRPGCPHPGSASPTRPSPPGRENLRRVLRVDGHRENVAVVLDGDDVHVHLGGRAYLLRYLDPVRSLGGDAAGPAENEARAPMPGTVLAVHVRPGDAVAAGDPLVVIESMKLETTIRSPRDGTVATVAVREGEGFDRDQVLATLAEAA